MTTSEDNIIALLAFFGKFPEFLTNELYISGESYGGIYVPYIAWQIYQHNSLAKFDESIVVLNLKGIIVGNGATDFTVDVNPTAPATYYNFNVITKSLFKTYEDNNCAFTFNDVIPYVAEASEICNQTNDAITELISDLNWYDIYRQTYPDNGLLQG